MRESDVIVLDASNKFLEYTHPARARQLLKEKSAVVYSRQPFAIQLLRIVNGPVVLTSREDKMAVTNYTDFFKSERDIYVQNISNCQVSVMFEVGPGHTESHLFVNSPDPVNLTQRVPFQAVKSSMDFRKMLNRQPPALRLMTEEQYREYYSKSAANKGLETVEDAIDAAERSRVEIQNHVLDKPVDLLKESESKVSTDEIQLEEDVISPRVLNLCLQVHPSLSEQVRLSAQSFLTELESIGKLGLQDWEYIQGHGYYKSVKNLAKKKVAELISQESEQDEEPKKAKSKK